MRVFLIFLSLVGLYPQYRAMKTILLGLGWQRGDWEEEHNMNRVKIYVTEPLIESLLQVIHFGFPGWNGRTHFDVSHPILGSNLWFWASLKQNYECLHWSENTYHSYSEVESKYICWVQNIWWHLSGPLNAATYGSKGLFTSSMYQLFCLFKVGGGLRPKNFKFSKFHCSYV